MTLNAKIGVFIDFLRLQTARHIPRANCAEINWNRHGEAACEIFSIGRWFWRPKSRFSRFKETCPPAHEGIKERYPRKSLYLTVVGQSFVKTVADRHGRPAYHNKH